MKMIAPVALIIASQMTMTSAVAEEISLPSEAIAGLRYYYPAEKVEERSIEVDICVYGGTSGGAVAAVQAARAGKRVALLEFGKHIGGLTSGGLCATDGGAPSVCGGIAREFYNEVGQRDFRPQDAENAFLDMLKEAGVEVFLLSHLKSVQKNGPRIESITMEDGLTVRAQQFIDCTYEGDLMAMAGVSFTVGREARDRYDEQYNGILTPGKGGHNFPVDISPYVVPDDAGSGLLPRINLDWGKTGDGDNRIQAYCFRMWLTEDNPMPFPKPPVYEPLQYELLARLFESGADPKIRWSRDTNNHHLFGGAYFIDYVGGVDAWPEGDYLTRERLFQDHVNYQLGVMWFLQNSDRIPQEYQTIFKKWGLPRDIYLDTGGWSHQLYIREGRRMVSDYVMTEHNCMGREIPEDSIGLASYNMDSHHCQMTVVDGAVRNEGNIEIRPKGPYPISYRAIVPKRDECTNLLVPLSLSASHITFGSIRMEPVFMILGQSSAIAACIAIDDQVDIQSVDYEKLKDRLLSADQRL
jgi:hypothetical protein